jgi:hypothetical protein
MRAIICVSCYSMSNNLIIRHTIIGVLKHIEDKPFLCLPLSALLYATLKDEHKLNPKLITGNLLFEDEFIFKQDFSLYKADETFKKWSGHAWVQIDDVIYDLSFFRTLYSTSFTKPCKNKLLNIFGERRGCLGGTPEQMNLLGLHYVRIDYLSDELATKIIKGIPSLLKKQN